jgi:hypothetical protein
MAPRQLAGDAQSGGAGAHHHRALRGELAARAGERRQHAGEADRAGALDVVVERRQPVAVAIQQVRGVVLAEVLPLQQRAREHFAHRLDELLHQRIVGLAAQPRPGQPRYSSSSSSEALFVPTSRLTGSV